MGKDLLAIASTSIVSLAVTLGYIGHDFRSLGIPVPEVGGEVGGVIIPPTLDHPASYKIPNHMNLRAIVQPLPHLVPHTV